MNHPTGKLILSAVLLLVTTSSIAKLSVSIDRNKISEADVVRLSIRIDDPGSTVNPDFSALEKDFEILRRTGPNQNSKFTTTNGRTTSEIYVTWEFSLRPRRLGQLTIPSLQIATERSRPIAISVIAQTSAMKRQMDQYVFFDTSVDFTETYVQGQILYTVKLYYIEGLSGDFPPAPQIADAVIETIENERRYDSIVNNRRYYVLEKSYAIYPQRSGELFIPKQTFSGTRGGSRFFSTSRERVNAISQSHSIKVKPRPSSFPGEHWLPAKNLELSELWNENPPVFKVGEPINRALTITVDGLADSLLPPFRGLEIEGTKTYTDPADRSQQVGPEGIISTSITTIGIVPTRAGQITIPEINVPWWNTQTDKLQIATIPAATYQVLDSALPDTTTPQPTGERVVPLSQISATNTPVQTAQSPFWMYISGALTAVWVMTLLLWWRQNQQRANLTPVAVAEEVPGSSETELFRRLITACKSNEAATARNLLFMWGKARFATIDSTRELASITESEALAEEITALETCLYSPASNETWNGKSLIAILNELNKKKTLRKKKTVLPETLNPAQ